MSSCLCAFYLPKMAGRVVSRAELADNVWDAQPPVGDAPHRYHFQVLALDTMLELKTGADRDDLLAAAEQCHWQGRTGRHVSTDGETTEVGIVTDTVCLAGGQAAGVR